MKKFLNVGVGGGVMADKVKYGRHVVAVVNHDAPEETLNEWFNLNANAKAMYELLYEMVPEDCSCSDKGDKNCWRCRGMELLQQVEGRKE